MAGDSGGGNPGGLAVSDDQAITRWAKVKSEMSEASKQVLADNGLTWDSFNELENNARSQMGDEVVQTEYGWVQVIPDGPVQYKVRRLEKPDEELTHKKRLKLLRRDNERNQ